MRINNVNNLTTKIATTGFNIYDIDFNNYSLLNANDELKNLNDAKCGNIMAIEKILSSNFRFVISIAIQYIDLGLPFSDLVNDGNLGLMKAIDRYDVSKKINFSNYAIWWIRSSIISSINDYNKIITGPVSENKSYSKVKAAIRLSSNQFEKEPAYENVMIYGNLTADEIYFLIKIYFKDILYNESTIFDDQEQTLTRIVLQKLNIGDSNKFNKKDFQQYIINTLGKVLCAHELEEVSQLYNFELLDN
jgi:RNA polymerase sigma factor (sigma-70 family)